MPLVKNLLSLRWIPLAVVAWVAVLVAGVNADSTVTVEVDASQVIRDDFLGVGVQWSSYPW